MYVLAYFKNMKVFGQTHIPTCMEINNRFGWQIMMFLHIYNSWIVDVDWLCSCPYLQKKSIFYSIIGRASIFYNSIYIVFDFKNNLFIAPQLLAFTTEVMWLLPVCH